MVMAGNENVSGALTDDALSARLQWLRQRREALQEKLTEKNNELKNLCVEEAEITGVLPPEIPLEPGESPPTFHRKIGISSTFPQKLINKLKSTEIEESELELERQIQLGIVETALGIVNDPTESKATRRKHRLAYQQSQRRLQELETELHFIRQSRGKTHRQSAQLLSHLGNYNTQLHSHVKHRTKKPRPPLDNTGNENTAAKSAGRGVMEETVISLSPLNSEDKCITYPRHGYEEQLAISNHHSNTYPRMSPLNQPNVKIVEHDHNDNHNVYILPERSTYFRPRTYSHGNSSSRSQTDYYQDPKAMFGYRYCVPHIYADDEFHIQRSRQHFQYLQKQQVYEQMQNHRLQYNSPEYKHLDNAEIIRRTVPYEKDFRVSQYAPDCQVYYKNNLLSQPLQRRGDRDVLLSDKNISRHIGTSIETQLPAGYWMRQDDEIVWVEEPHVSTDRFGSLDRRRRNTQHSSVIGMNPDVQSRYRTVAVASAKNSGSNNVAASSYQHHSVHLLPLTEQQIPASNKMLLRTQSLGSVETWQSSQGQDLHDGKDSITTECVSRKSRQKEWYETSLDSGVSASHNSIATHKNSAQYVQSNSPPACIKVNNNGGSRDSQLTTTGPLITSSANRHKRDKPEERHHTIQSRYDQSTTRPKVLEIPAESKPSHDIYDDAVQPLGSPQNCTVVQAGKYQPYREMTKPFEMSDFYKYSTKFRKRNETTGQCQLSTGNNSPLQENRPVEYMIGSNDSLKDSNPHNYRQNSGATAAASPVQRRIYQPVQRMTCQPYLTSLR